MPALVNQFIFLAQRGDQPFAQEPTTLVGPAVEIIREAAAEFGYAMPKGARKALARLPAVVAMVWIEDLGEWLTFVAMEHESICRAIVEAGIDFENLTDQELTDLFAMLAMEAKMVCVQDIPKRGPWGLELQGLRRLVIKDVGPSGTRVLN